ncbi:MAG: photosystem II assembly protein [Cyanobacteriota bacterium]|nr:photosystem II assembly protein [Cyanobacteriota bacterium]
MTNPLINWWRSQKFRGAIKRGDRRLARNLLQEIQKSGAKLSWPEKLFKQQLKLEKSLKEKKREIASLSKHLKEANQQREAVELQEDFGELDFGELDESRSTLNPEFIEFVSDAFELSDRDENMVQCTGIDGENFYELESSLVEYIEAEFKPIAEGKLQSALKDATEDIEGLRQGIDPDYNLSLTPHVYFLKYFLENVYCNYLAWFLIYKHGLLPSKINILDIAAGPGTVAYGLALLLNTGSSFFSVEPMHISYYSLEKQKSFQYRGLQFWRKYIEEQKPPTNTYFRFDTTDIFAYNNESKKLPANFFDFAVVSHCFFADPVQRNKSYEIYKEIFRESLKSDGYVLIIVQGRKLFKAYNLRPTDDLIQERNLIQKVVGELGLKLEWYKYLTSTGTREYVENFGKFAKENLPRHKHINKLQRQYLGLRYDSNYTIDDYVILAKL